MTEHDDPFECKCPKSILALLTPIDSEYANTWRMRCEEYHKQQAERRKQKRTATTVFIVGSSQGKVTKTTSRRIFFSTVKKLKTYFSLEDAENEMSSFGSDNTKKLSIHIEQVQL